MGVLLAVWAGTPLRENADPGQLVELAAPFARKWWSMPVAIATFAFGALIFMPLTLLIAVLVLLYGTWKGFLVSWLGAVLSAAMGHAVGRFLWRETMAKLAGNRWNSITGLLQENDLRTTIVLRLIPVAPFTLVNLMAGSLHIQLRPFLLGTVVDSIPFLALLCFASESIIEAVRNPNAVSVLLACAIVVALVLLSIAIERFRRRHTEDASR